MVIVISGINIITTTIMIIIHFLNEIPFPVKDLIWYEHCSIFLTSERIIHHHSIIQCFGLCQLDSTNAHNLNLHINLILRKKMITNKVNDSNTVLQNPLLSC
jgi:hypothetical protein